MLNITRSAAATLLAAIALTGPALAQPADLPTYQGRLTDSGQPANGTYEINVNYYDSAVGGTWLAGDGHTGVVVTDGLFMVPMAAYEFSSFGSGLGEIWLDLEVRPGGSFDPYTPLAPRQIVTKAPLAHRALNANNADSADIALAADFALASGTGLTEAYLNDPTVIGNGFDAFSILGTELIVGNGVRIGQPNSSDGRFNLFSSEVSTPIVTMGPSGFFGGIIQVKHALNDTVAISLQTDSVGGGYINVTRNNSGDAGVIIDGNKTGTSASRLTIFGTSGTHTDIDASISSGTDAFKTVDGAIDAFEILDEPGVAAARRNAANVALGISSTAVLTRTITAPAAGFVQMSGVAEVNVVHTIGTATTITVGMGVNSNSYLNGVEHGHYIPPSAASGTYIVVVPALDVIPVTSGSATSVRLLASVSGGTGIIVDSALSALYVPTAYGTTAGSILHDPSADDKTNTIGAITPQLHAAERDQEQQWSTQQLIDRMARLEARLKVQQGEIDRLNSIE
ncbi:MAG: hypothetical protein ACI89L_001068 [Phycisphaerales bacterium]|jgi:hypothetical protein